MLRVKEQENQVNLDNILRRKKTYLRNKKIKAREKEKKKLLKRREKEELGEAKRRTLLGRLNFVRSIQQKRIKGRVLRNIAESKRVRESSNFRR